MASPPSDPSSNPRAALDPEGTATDELTGRVLGDFVVGSKLGEGGFGTVYRAEQKGLGREAVIKVLLAEIRGQGLIVQRFLREARLASHFDHPFAAHVYAFGAEADGLLWIALELVRGTTLHELLRTQGPLSLARFLPLFERICEVVHAAHEQGLIHRDIKPANVMVVSRAGRLSPKLLDFGIAKVQEATSDAELATATPAGPAAPRFPVEASGAELSDSLRENEVYPATRTGRARTLGRSIAVGKFSETATDLTLQSGGFLGSPHAMAPEQWMKKADIDARADIYALGVLCFQMLTGKAPFGGASVKAIARSHATSPVPSLGEKFPPGLQAVLDRALAKDREQRFTSALDFAIAFREACLEGNEPLPLPQLEELLRASILAEAPRPVADAVAALEYAQSLPQASEACRQLIATVVRYLAVLAISARSLTGPPVSGDAPEVLALFERLRTSKLSLQEWLALTAALCKPHAHRPELHPLPELVQLFHRVADEAPARAYLLMLEAASTVLGPDCTAVDVHPQVERLGAVLKSVSGVFTYELAVPRREGIEHWRGARRTRSAGAMLPMVDLVPDQALLLDRLGAPLLKLWPLAQVVAPSPGAPEELFLLEGEGRHGAKLCALPLPYERHDEGLWAWWESHVCQLAGSHQAEDGEESTPYLGLASFSTRDSSNFFGREKEAEAFANRLRVHPLLAVVGPSGTGKSSFIQAGVLPLLLPTWRALTVRPGTSPIGALLERLGRDGINVDGLREAILTDPAVLGQRLREHVAAEEVLVVVVDQFEELLTLCADMSERNAYARALVEAAQEGGPVRVVLTLRDDFLIRVQALPALKERLAQGLQLLGTPSSEDLKRIVTEPARRAGYALEDEGLGNEMVAAVLDQPGALALLSFTASKLWELRDRHFLRLTRKAYQALGGVGGALANHAEATLTALPSNAQGLVREVFRHLVTAEGTRAILTRREMQEVLGQATAGERVLEELIQARLLVASEGLGGEDRIEVIHEALLGSWPRLVRWQREDAEAMRVRDALRAAARQWVERGRARDLLWRGEPLMEYRLWKARYPGSLTAAEGAFAKASLQAEARGRRVRMFLATTAFVVLAVGLGVLYRANGKASRSAREAQMRVAQLHVEQGRQYLLAADPSRALLHLSQAYTLGADSPGLRYLLGRSKQARLAQRAVLPHDDLVVGLAFANDGKSLFTTARDGMLRHWSTDDGRLLQRYQGHGDWVYRAVPSADGSIVLTTSRDRTARLWQMNGSVDSELLYQGAFNVAWGGFLPGEKRIWVGAVREHGLKVVDLAQRQVVQSLPEHKGTLMGAELSPDGQFLLSWDMGGQMQLTQLETNSVVTRFTQHTGPANAAAFTSDGRWIVTGGQDQKVYMWDATTGRARWSFTERAGVVYALAISKDGSVVAVASQDAVVKILDATTGALLGLLRGHEGEVNSVAFSPNGQLIATGSTDGVARLWTTRTYQSVATLAGHVDGISRVQFSPDGQLLATASGDRTARLWDVSRAIPSPLSPYVTDVEHLHFTRDGSALEGISESGELETWKLGNHQELSRAKLSLKELLAAAFSPDGAWVATAHEQEVTLHSMKDGALRCRIGDLGTKSDALDFSPDGSHLAVGLYTGPVAVVALDGCRTQQTLRLHQKPVTGVAYSADGRLLASMGRDNQVGVWDVATGALRHTLKGHTQDVYAGAFSPGGTELATGGADKRLILWDVSTGKQIRILEGSRAAIREVRFSPDGHFIASGSLDGTVQLWDVDTGLILDRFREEGLLASAGFHPGGQSFFTAADASAPTLRSLVLETQTPAEVARDVRCHVPMQLEGDAIVISPVSCGEPAQMAATDNPVQAGSKK